MNIVNYADIVDRVVDNALDVPIQTQNWYIKRGLEYVGDNLSLVNSSSVFNKNEPVMLSMINDEKTRFYVRGLWLSTQKDVALTLSSNDYTYTGILSEKIDKDLEYIKNLMISGNPKGEMVSQLETTSFYEILGIVEKKKTSSIDEWPEEQSVLISAWNGNF